MFFDEYPLFLETSETAARASRLNLRHTAMIEANRDILRGARVLDLASHDGRWSFAALEAGAAHVTGVEARQVLVDNANNTFEKYGVPSERYRFIKGDMFRVLKREQFDVDVVLCLGFLYHTLRYGELFKGIAKATPRYCVIDTKVHPGEEMVVGLHLNKTGVQSNAAPDQVSHRRQTVAGWPTVPALEMILGIYDFQVEQRYDWPGLLAANGYEPGTGGEYERGDRVTLRCRARDVAQDS